MCVWKNDFGLATAGIREFLRFSRSLIKWKRLELSPLNGERAYLAVKGGRDEWISESDWKIYLGNDLELLQTDTYEILLRPRSSRNDFFFKKGKICLVI